MWIVGTSCFERTRRFAKKIHQSCATEICAPLLINGKCNRINHPFNGKIIIVQQERRPKLYLLYPVGSCRNFLPSLQEIGKQKPLHIVKLQTSKNQAWDTTYNCTRQGTHLCMHPRITHPYYEPNEPTSLVGRWSRPQPVLPWDEQQTFLKNEQKVFTQKIANRTLEKILLQALHHKSTLQPG